MKLPDESFLSRKSFLVAGTVLVLGVLSALGYHLYKDEDKSTGQTVTSFHQFKWKTSRKKIFDLLGSPEQSDQIRVKDVFRDSSEPGVKIIYPSRRVDGETVDIGFIFHRTKGLLKGQYHYHFGLKNDCRRIFDKLYRKVNDRYRSYQVSRGEYNHMDDPFCVAVLVGKASKYAQWELPGGTTISLVVGSDYAKKRVKLLYETSAYYRWVNRVEDSGEL